MGWCHEFGCQIVRGCDHPMQAGEAACSCSICRTVCEGRYDGCHDVWARGPRRFETVVEPARPIDPPPGADLSRVPPPARPAATVDRAQAQETGMRVLAWMRDEFDGLRSQLQTLAGSVAQNQAVVRELAENRADDLDETLAELEARAAELRGEASRLAGMEASLTDTLPGLVAEAVRPQVRAAIDDRLPSMVDEVIQPELRAALNDVETCTAELRDETMRLRTFREELADRLPKLVGDAVEQALARAPGPATAPPRRDPPPADEPAAAGFVEVAPEPPVLNGRPAAAAVDAPADAAPQPGGGDR